MSCSGECLKIFLISTCIIVETYYKKPLSWTKIKLATLGILIVEVNVNPTIGLGLWCLMPLSTIF
jgi:hypothetical protein